VAVVVVVVIGAVVAGEVGIGVEVAAGAAGTEVEGTGIDHAGCRWVERTRVAYAGSLESNQCLIDQLRSTAKKGVIVGPGSCL
jgi:hypothetical protein